MAQSQKPTSQETQESLNAYLVALLLTANTGKTEEWAEDRVYYQANETTKLLYPCLVYQKTPAHKVHADNLVYRRMQAYEVTYIDRSPNSSVFDVLSDRRYCSHLRSFASDGLNHDVFDLYH